MVAMIGVGMTLTILAIQHRVPSLAKAIGEFVLVLQVPRQFKDKP